MRIHQGNRSCWLIWAALFGLFTVLMGRTATAFCGLENSGATARPHPSTIRLWQSSSPATEQYYSDFERAVECACATGLCAEAEVTRLANVLEGCEGCYFYTTDADDCQQEMVDRQDVADILRLQANLYNRQVYLENANVFCERIFELRKNMADNESNEILQRMDRAVTCATQPGTADSVKELQTLADDLESYTGCLIDDDDCEQEKIDRQDVADILRMEANLQLRQVYLQNANSFKEAVEEAQTNKDAL